MSKNNAVAFCNRTGQSYTQLQIDKGLFCYKKGKYTYCMCHNEKLVVEYPFKIKI